MKRRTFLKAMGIGAVGAGLGLAIMTRCSDRGRGRR